MNQEKKWTFMFPTWQEWVELKESTNACQCTCENCKEGKCSSCSCENCKCSGCSCE